MILFMIFFFLVSIYMTIYLKWPQFKAFKNIKKCKNKKSKQTFYLTLATNLGVGNLVGVSAAIKLGGPGVIFWMALFAFFTSSLSFLENYYAVKSQTTIDKQQFAGTSYTISKYFKSKHSKVLSIVFSIFLILTNTIFFPPIQINTIVSLFESKNRLVFSLILIVLVFIIITKGIKLILKISDNFLPFFAGIYFFIIMIAIILKLDTFFFVVKNIIEQAFSFKALGAATFFSMLSVALSKSLFSHEAGLGTIPSLTGVADKEEAEIVGSYQLISVIVDTVVLCTMTGIFILMYSNYENCNIHEILMVAFENFIGKFGLVMYSIFVIFFAVSSVIGQYYLGETNMMFFFKDRKTKNKWTKIGYQSLFMIGISIGIFGTFDNIMELLDFGILILGTLNIVVLLLIERCQKLLKNKHKIT